MCGCVGTRVLVGMCEYLLYSMCVCMFKCIIYHIMKATLSDVIFYEHTICEASLLLYNVDFCYCMYT